ncbi:hypothetical protein N24_3182 [Corynebacterium suranareeae]|uniref:Uncharacterized protein n=1 Tax=Corynebacterium suranareeae TaxID=2506452 RepID=A0A169SDA8_9CORY|nr:hypothetical protein N24_3182 [Corynebacterium suranareeae]
MFDLKICGGDLHVRGQQPGFKLGVLINKRSAETPSATAGDLRGWTFSNESRCGYAFIKRLQAILGGVSFGAIVTNVKPGSLLIKFSSPSALTGLNLVENSHFQPSIMQIFVRFQ